MKIFLLDRKNVTRIRLDEYGFSLIEGMLAAVILAIGLLALAGMQGMSIGRNVDANELTLATNLAADMIERMQFNRRNAATYNNIDTLDNLTRPTTNIMAGGDYDQWQFRLANSRLPSVQGRVTVNAFGPVTPTLNQSDVIVEVRWQGSIKSDTSVSRQRTLRLQTVIAPE